MDGMARLAGARIGPNAITRVAEALRAAQGADATRALFDAAGLSRHLEHPPGHMVAEEDVVALHAALRATVPGWRIVARDAGRRTGDYLLAHRIPRAVQAVLRLMPSRLAARMLSNAIARHAWTFAGSGRFSAHPGRPALLVIEGCPLARGAAAAHPVCDCYAATFERVFRALVHRRATATEIACEGTGAPACRFSIAW